MILELISQKVYYRSSLWLMLATLSKEEKTVVGGMAVLRRLTCRTKHPTGSI